MSDAKFYFGQLVKTQEGDTGVVVNVGYAEDQQEWFYGVYLKDEKRIEHFIECAINPLI